MDRSTVSEEKKQNRHFQRKLLKRLKQGGGTKTEKVTSQKEDPADVKGALQGSKKTVAKARCVAANSRCG